MIPVKTLIRHCRTLPHTTEDVKWDKDLVFSVGGKMFAVFDKDELDQFSFKAATDEFARLTAVAGVTPAPYLARHHWVAVRHDAKLPSTLLKELLEGSHRMVFEKLPLTVRRKLTGGAKKAAAVAAAKKAAPKAPIKRAAKKSGR